MKVKLISKHIRLPQEILAALEREAFNYGYELNAWIRIILTDRSIDIISRENSERALARKIAKVFKRTPIVKHPALRNDAEIDDFIDSLKNKEI